VCLDGVVAVVNRLAAKGQKSFEMPAQSEIFLKVKN
jgi:hypothetical protein